MPGILWLNGCFGAGKTSVAHELIAAVPGWRLFDPEFVGFMLRAQLADIAPADFQDLPSWRRLVPIVIDEVAATTGADLVIAQTVLDRAYWQELADGIRAREHSLHHVLLDAGEASLRQRISEDEVLHRAAGWRLQHLPPYFAARENWLAESADLVIDTTDLSPRAGAHRIAEAMHAWTICDPAGPDDQP